MRVFRDGLALQPGCAAARRPRRCIAAVLLALAATGAPAAAPDEGAGAAASAPAVQTVRLPMEVEGDAVALVAELLRPPGPGPFPLVIFSHGRAGTPAERAALARPLPAAQARYWLARGVAVLAPVRPGYGATGGADRENSGARWHGPVCLGAPDYAATASHARDTVTAAWRWARAQPWVQTDRLLLVGQSVGGLTTMAAAALDLPGVIGAVNFAGGAGGNPHGAPGHSCRPERLATVYGAMGPLVHVPTLWLYASNDEYWGAEAPRGWFDAFAAGGSAARFVQTGPVEGGGHQLVRRGAALWQAPLDAFVAEVGLLRR